MPREVSIHVYIRKCAKFSPLNLEEVSDALYFDLSTTISESVPNHAVKIAVLQKDVL